MKRRSFKYSILVIILAVIISVSWFLKIEKQKTGYEFTRMGASITRTSDHELNEMKDDIGKSQSNLLVFIGIAFVIFVFLRTLERNDNRREIEMDLNEENSSTYKNKQINIGKLLNVLRVLLILLLLFIGSVKCYQVLSNNEKNNKDMGVSNHLHNDITSEKINNNDNEDVIKAVNTITADNLIESICGWWGYKSDISYELLHVFDNKIQTGMAEGQLDREGTIRNVVKKQDGSFELTVYYPESYLFEEYYPEDEGKFHISSNDNFQKNLILIDELGNKYNYTFAGKEDYYSIYN